MRCVYHTVYGAPEWGGGHRDHGLIKISLSAEMIKSDSRAAQVLQP